MPKFSFGEIVQETSISVPCSWAFRLVGPLGGCAEVLFILLNVSNFRWVSRQTDLRTMKRRLRQKGNHASCFRRTQACRRQPQNLLSEQPDRSGLAVSSFHPDRRIEFEVSSCDVLRLTFGKFSKQLPP